MLYSKIGISKLIKNLMGPIIFLTFLILPLNLDQQPQQFLAIFLLVVWLWIFSEVPLFISGMLGVALSTVFGLVTPKDALAPLADPIIFLFLSGFLFAKALEMTELDEYLAHKILGHPKIKNDPKKIILGFLFIAFFSSMWISNTAAVAMLLPLSYGVLKTLKVNFGIESDKLNEALLLSLAYCATVGGNLSPIGSPPNLIAIGLLKNLAGKDFSFIKWIAMALPVALIFFSYIYKRCISTLPKQYELKKKVIQKIRKTEIQKDKLTSDQKNVLYLFFLTIFFWILPGLLGIFISKETTLYHFVKNNLSTATVGIFFSSLLFLFPLNRSEKILNSKQISQIDWGSLLLFGTGLSLGSILFKTGLAEIVANHLTSMSTFISPTIILLIFILGTIFFTELASNTASANIIIPIMIAFAQEADLNVTVAAFAQAVSCNSAFMLPVATPPNVIVYGTNRVSKKAMIKAGWRLNFLGFGVIAIYTILFNL